MTRKIESSDELIIQLSFLIFKNSVVQSFNSKTELLNILKLKIKNINIFFNFKNLKIGYFGKYQFLDFDFTKSSLFP